MRYELALVVPIYNEERCIGQVVESWRRTLSTIGMNHLLILLNDGSTDNTKAELEPFSHEEWAQVIHKANSGHGPTILEGYAKAVDLADWVFQCDSDDEIRPDHLPGFWTIRESFDAVIGVRTGRVQSLGRSVISFCSRWTVRALFGKGVVDVNCPYRLIRSSVLKPILARIPPDTFAPNVIISGALSHAGARIHNEPVLHEGRRTGVVSIVRWRLWKAAIRSFLQTIRASRKTS